MRYPQNWLMEVNKNTVIFSFILHFMFWSTNMDAILKV